MQDRYAGDIGDYGKIGLLKALQAQGLSVGVNWYLTEPLKAERRADGSFKQQDGRYRIPEACRACDETLADVLARISDSIDRSVRAIEQADLITDAAYYHDLLKPGQEARRKWHERSLEALFGADLVFLDPDNGLLVKSVKKAAARSVKYAFYEEVRDHLERGQSVLIYNHRSRKKESVYFHDIFLTLHDFTGVPAEDIMAITFPRRSVRDYLAVPASQEHRGRIAAAFHAMEDSTWGMVGMCKEARM